MRLALVKDHIEPSKNSTSKWTRLQIANNPLIVGGKYSTKHMSDLVKDDIVMATERDLEKIEKILTRGQVKYQFIHDEIEYCIEAELWLNSNNPLIELPESRGLFKREKRKEKKVLEELFGDVSIRQTQGCAERFRTSLEKDPLSSQKSYTIKASVAPTPKGDGFPWIREDEFLERMTRFLSRVEGAYNALYEQVNKVPPPDKTLLVGENIYHCIESVDVSEKNGVQVVAITKGSVSEKGTVPHTIEDILEMAKMAKEGVWKNRKRDNPQEMEEEKTRRKTETITQEKTRNIRDTRGPYLKDIGGCEEAKERLKTVIDYLHDPVTFLLSGSAPPKGVLLHGPPGTGKTSLAKALANETDAHFYEIKGSSFKNRYYGDTEERLEGFLQDVESRNKYTILFIDEAEHLLSSGHHVNTADEAIVSRFRTFIDGMRSVKNVFVMLATNHSERIDEAIRDRLLKVHVGLPDTDARIKIIEYSMREAYESGKAELELRELDSTGYRWMYDQSFNPRAIAEKSEGVNGRTLNKANWESLEYRRKMLPENPDYLITTELFLKKLGRLEENKKEKRNVPGFGG